MADRQPDTRTRRRTASAQPGRGRAPESSAGHAPAAGPLSESAIWGWLRTYYEHQGVKAWSSGAVPMFITTNTFIARSYAHVVAAHLQEQHARGALDPAQPVYVVELGAGHGRFGYLMLRRLLGLLGSGPLRDLQLRYVMTDVAESNLAFQAEHPLLRELFERGVLDQAHFDCEETTELVLRRSGERLAPGGVANPMVVVANYIFDSLRNDAFRLVDGVLEECLVVGAQDAEPDWDDPQALEKIELTYEYVKVGSGRYDDPVLDEVLASYGDVLSDTTFLIPVGALSCLGRLRALCDDRLFVITADKGYNHVEDLLWHGDPQPTGHGSFSLSVNYNAIGEYVRRSGGQALHTSSRRASLVASAFVLDGARGAAGTTPGSAVPATELAFREHVEGYGPIDFFALQTGLARLAPQMKIPEILAAVRMSDFDPRLLHDFCRPLLELLDEASEEEHREVRDVLARCWENYFPLGESLDLPFHLGRLHSRMKRYRDALRYYRFSLDLFGEDPSTHQNMGLAWVALGELDEASAAFDRVLATDPGSSSARSWRLRLLAERGSR